MDRRNILKSLMIAPVAAMTFNKTGKTEEKTTYGKLDLDQRIDEQDFRIIAGSGTITWCSG